MEIKIASLNCRGMRQDGKRRKIFQLLKSRSIDICFVQETHCINIKEGKNWGVQWGGPAYWSFGQSNSCGVGILFSSALDLKFQKFHYDHEGRLLYVDINILGVQYRLICTYMPTNSQDRKNFIKKLQLLLHTSKKIIWGGDFNFVESLILDKEGGNFERGSVGVNEFSSVKTDFDLVDVYRNLYKNQKVFTWSDSSDAIHCRLDRFYISKCLCSLLSDIEVFPVPWSISDHSLVEVSFKAFSSDTRQLGPGYWKCNTSVLSDRDFKADLEMSWANFAEIEDKDGDWWDGFKSSVKRLVILHSNRLSLQSQKHLHNLMAQFRDLKAQERVNPGIHAANILRIEFEIESLLVKTAHGAKIRSKAKYLDDAEKPTRYFLRKEKNRGQHKFISELETAKGKITEKSDILKYCKEFYKELYSKVDIDQSLLDFFVKDLPKLSEEQSAHLEGHITRGECQKAISKMKNSKAPGIDGLPKEFYQKYFYLFGDEFVTLINRLYEEGSLSTTQRVGVITLLCKEPKSAFLLSKWRPISLLCVDYKIISKAICNRLKSVMGIIVNIDQTCSIPGRSISDNIHLIRNIVDYANQKQLPCAIISFDQAKAFDRVSHDYMFQVLKGFNFGPSFIKWVNLLYHNVFSMVLVNGFFTEPFQIFKSVRQGCSLSPLLYVLCMEPLAIKVRQDPHISGLRIPGSSEEVRIIQYADDTNLVVTTIASIRKVFLLWELYGLASGSSLNKDKCWGLWLGGWKNNPEKAYGLNWVSDSKKIFGIYLGNSDVVTQNWEQVLSKFSRSIDDQKGRFITLRGRSVLLHSVICSKIWYVGSHFWLPTRYEEALNKKLFAFLWGGKNECVKRKTLLGGLPEGGLGVCDLSAKIKGFHIKHIKQLCFGDYCKWHSFAIYWVGQFLRKYNSAFASNFIPHSEQMPVFYRQVLDSLNQCVMLKPSVELERITTNSAYQIFLSGRVVAPRVLLKFPTVDFVQVWSNVWNKFVSQNVQNLAWKLAHNILPVKSYLYHLNICKSVACPFCTRPETAEHLFFQCPMTQLLWAKVTELLVQTSQTSFKLGKRIILFSIFEISHSAHLNSLFLQLVGEARVVIWSCRNQKLKEGKAFTPEGLVLIFLSNLRERIWADFMRLDRISFCSFWTMNNVLSSVTGNDLVINF